MKIYFSKRHSKAIRKNELPLNFPETLRISILRTLQKYSDWGGWNAEENFSFENTKEILKTFYGQNEITLDSCSEDNKPVSISTIILKGSGVQVIDVIEAWFDQSHRKESQKCEEELNVCFKIHDCPWRIVNGEALLVNSEYLTEEISARLLRLFDKNENYAELRKFYDAIIHLQSGNYTKAIIEARNSVLNLIKHALELQKDYSPDELLSRFISSGMMPHDYTDFLKTFVKLVQGAIQNENGPTDDCRSNESEPPISRYLAEFIINLAGSINLFIVQNALIGSDVRHYD